MRELPILFSTDMVRAILDGRKTMTRRIIKFYGRTPIDMGRELFYKTVNGLNNKIGLFAGFYKDSDVFMCEGEQLVDAVYFKSPYLVGDKLYVRETWAREGSNEQDEKHPFRDENYNEWYATGEDFEFYGYVYKADTPNAKYPSGYPDDYEGAPTWHPSIHMPKEAARIWLEVTDVRVERLQEITEEDAVKEGVKAYGPNNCSGTSARIAFAQLWDSIYQKQGHGWEVNDWVWVYGLKRLEGHR